MSTDLTPDLTPEERALVVAIIADALTEHGYWHHIDNDPIQEFLCGCGANLGKPENAWPAFRAHQAEQIAARLGIEPIGAWGQTSRLAPVRADGTTEQFELYRVRALESQ